MGKKQQDSRRSGCLSSPSLKSRIRIPMAVITAAVAVSAPRIAAAASGTWSGLAGDGLWETPGNWDNVPGGIGTTTSTDVATFSGAPTSTAVAVDAGRNIFGITFDATSLAFRVGDAIDNAGNTLTLTDAGLSQVTNGVVHPGGTATLTSSITAPLVLAGGSYTFRNDNTTTLVGFRVGGSITAGTSNPTTIYLDGVNSAGVNLGQSQVHGTISDGPGGGVVSVVKQGTGTWELRSTTLTTGNSYSGETRVQGGVLRFSSFTAASPNSTIVADGGKLQFSSNMIPVKQVRVESGTVSTSNSTTTLALVNSSGPGLDFSLNGGVAGTYSMTSVFAMTGPTANQGGVLLRPLTSGQVDLGGTSTPLNIGTLARPFDIARSGTAPAYDLRVRGPIQGGSASGGIVKTGTGILRFDNANNPFVGKLEIQQGTVIINNENALTGVPELLITGGELNVKGTVGSGAIQTFSTVTMTKGTIARNSSSSAVRAASFTFDVADGDEAHANTVLADSTGPATVTKNGPGLAELDGINTYTGATVVNAGKLLVNRSSRTSASLTVNGGRYEMEPNGTDTLQVGALSISATGVVDLNDNDLVVDNGNFTDIQAAVLTGFGNIAGPGITSSTSDGTQILALFDNAQVGSVDWNGGTIGANAVVGKYTYFGDVNLDGQVTGDDYAVVDSNLDTDPPVGLEWLSGDANLDGIVTGDDYATIDSNLGLGSGNPLSPQALASGIAAVPEPGSMGLLSVAAAGALSRRRRRQN